MSYDINLIAVMIGAFVLAYLYASENKKENIIEKYIWLFGCLSLITFGLLSAQIDSYSDCFGIITGNTLCYAYVQPDLVINSLGNGFAIVFILFICVFVWKIYQAYKGRNK